MASTTVPAPGPTTVDATTAGPTGHHGGIGLNNTTAVPAGTQAGYPVALPENPGTFKEEVGRSNAVTADQTAALHHNAVGNTHTTTAPTENATVTAIVGKVEHVVGSLLHNEALKEKGIAKEHKAAEIKAEKAEIERAQLLEQEAVAARDRAAGHANAAQNGVVSPVAPAGAFNNGPMQGVLPMGPNIGGHTSI